MDRGSGMHRRVRRGVAVGTACALIATIALFSTPAGAADPVRKSATSAATGASYTMTWSCAGGQVRIVGTKGAVDFMGRFKVEPSTTWLTRVPSSHNDHFEWETGGNNRNDNGTATRVVLEDQVVGSSTWTPVMTLDVPSCPDYTTGPRSVFTGITPTRVLDTRPATAVNYSGPKPASGDVVKIPASFFPGLPADAIAVSVTVTGTQSSAPGYLQVFPTGLAEVGSSSNVNFPTAGGTVANLAVVSLGTDRSISIYTLGGNHIIVDVNGYFVQASGPVAAGRLVTTTQKRLLDTRPATAINYTGNTPSNQTIRVDLTKDGSGLPPGANAAVVNVTATQSGAAGFLQTDAGGSLVPGASSVLNLTGPGQTVAALAIVPLAADGSIDVYTKSSAHVLVDLIGWFTGPTVPASTTGQFVPLTPERIYDTRTNSMVNVSTFWDPVGISYGFVDIPGLDKAMGAVFINGTVTGTAGAGYVAFGSGVGTSNVNFTAPNSTVANAAVVATSAVRFNVTARPVTTHVIVDLSGYFTI